MQSFEEYQVMLPAGADGVMPGDAAPWLYRHRFMLTCRAAPSACCLSATEN